MKKVLVSFLLLVSLVVGADELSHAKREPRGNKQDTPTLRQIESYGRSIGAPPQLITIVKTISCVESECGANPVPAREKSKTWARLAAKVTKDKKRRDALQHSYGSTQLSGIYTLLDYGVQPEALLDDDVNISIAFDKAGKLYQRCQRSKYCTYSRWNGTGEQARRYARKAQKIESTV